MGLPHKPSGGHRGLPSSKRKAPRRHCSPFSQMEFLADAPLGEVDPYSEGVLPESLSLANARTGTRPRGPSDKFSSKKANTLVPRERAPSSNMVVPYSSRFSFSEKLGSKVAAPQIGPREGHFDELLGLRQQTQILKGR